jgi:hypothetical protein
MGRRFMSSHRIEDEWRSFCITCFSDISEQQYIDLRRTFYGGVAGFINIVTQHSDIPVEQLYEELKDELRTFLRSVKEGRS